MVHFETALEVEEGQAVKNLRQIAPVDDFSSVGQTQ